ncbi:hypothetical protein FDECE_16042 [Fusarium decemcellulare]|nr:hypothetical protein FDECE_16042 [Fusarium decemcellulare]
MEAPPRAFGCGRPYYDVAGNKVTPLEVGAYLLASICRDAEAQMHGTTVTSCPLGVPARFNARQKFEVKMAATVAGFTTVGLIEEPIAAAVACTNQAQAPDVEYRVVVDMGDGTIDLSLIYFDPNSFVVKATSGSKTVGGWSIIRSLMDAVVAKCGGDKAQLNMDRLEA